MEIYLVGGAVRDQLLGLPVKDRDWVVVGATPEMLLSQGYQQVGKDFPVFLNPESHEEYALARTERKSGKGYTGFICDFSDEITLEQDLIRRDLTINAIAQDKDGKLHDPYHGVEDIHQRILRHISPAFSEDPLRVLRVARFAARFHHLGFSIAEETLKLMAELTEQGELAHLTAERVWMETEKALNEPHPEIYFETLHQVGALTENTDLNKSAVRFAAICHDLGKALTPKEMWPSHHGHEKAGIKPTRSLCKRLRVPNYLQELAELTCEYHTHVHKVLELRPETVVKLFNTFDVWRKPQRFEEFLLVCLSDTRGRTGFENKEYPQIDYLKALYQAALAVDVQQVIADGFEKQGIRDELTRRRIAAVKAEKTHLNA